MKYFIFLLFVAVFSEIQIRPVLAAGQQLFNSFDNRPANKGNSLFSDRDDGVIIIAALRRPGGTFRGKYKKIIETTTRKVVKVSTTEASTSTTEASTSTTEATEPTTEKVIQVTHEEVLTTLAPVKITKDIRRNQLATQDRQNSLWSARKRVTRPTTAYVQKKKALKVTIVDDEEDYSVRRARYLFTQRAGRK
ncbi:uncharacterized protein LOC119075117 [Bradysia coprophila]|uniref:uncharacterized protein LOC119075117 n=1 Tax=Bradysia coprophila TaxID=38358 RepID=UPI00187DAF4C|nr:uncharacterized protein LOC119075117 [Bradysia coprophila]